MSGGFKWKEKPLAAAAESGEAESEKRLERGYRAMERPRPARSPGRDDVRNKFGDDYRERYSRPTRASDVANKFGTGADDEGEGVKGEKRKKKEKKVKGPKPTGEPLIVVNVNDRLGTKVSIPCLASDPISELCEIPCLVFLSTNSLWTQV